jgi:hypothetical protein
VKAVVFVPSAPLLLFGGGPPDLRAALDEALDSLTGEVVVLGSAPTPGWVEGTVDRTPYGAPGAPAADPLPLALAVGRTLLGARPHRLWGVPSADLPDADSVLVVADGTAKRSEKAPGHLDARAEAFDDAVARALEQADQQALSRLDPVLAAELWVQGLPAWQAAARLSGAWVGRLTYAQAPFGVGYTVAVWTF